MHVKIDLDKASSSTIKVVVRITNDTFMRNGKTWAKNLLLIKLVERASDFHVPNQFADCILKVNPL